MNEEKKSRTGLDSNVASLLAYVLGWVTGLLFLLLEKRDEFVRFHAMQSVIFFGAVTIVAVVLWALLRVPHINILFMVLLSLLGLAAFAVWVILMVKAYQGDRFKLPWVGQRAHRRVVKNEWQALP